MAYQIIMSWVLPDQLDASICTIQISLTYLIRLSCHKTAPYRISFRPEILALIIKSFSIFIQHNSKWNTVNSACNATIIFWSSGIDRNRKAAPGALPR